MLNRLWSAWQRFGRWIGDQVARVFLTVFYFTLGLPFGLLVRLTQDPLDLRKEAAVNWVERERKGDTLAEAERLY